MHADSPWSDLSSLRQFLLHCGRRSGLGSLDVEICIDEVLERYVLAQLGGKAPTTAKSWCAAILAHLLGAVRATRPPVRPFPVNVPAPPDVWISKKPVLDGLK